MGSPGRSAWTAGQVARHLGIAESTLRSWHRRYGIGPQGSRPGRYRRYSEDDVARLRRMLDLIGLGMLASEAARTVQAGESEPVPAERDVADLIAAARAADAERCRIVLDSVLARRGVVDGWDLVCRPALAAVDADQRYDPDCMDIEHGLSWAILGALHRIPRPPVSPDTVLVLLACVEAEHHTLPLAAWPPRWPRTGSPPTCWVPPRRRRAWCGRCGTPLPGPWSSGPTGEIPPGPRCCGRCVPTRSGSSPPAPAGRPSRWRGPGT